MKKQLLIETKAPFVFKRTKSNLVERTIKGKKKDVYEVEGIFGKVDKKNENNRTYPKRVIEKNLVEGSPFSNRLARRRVLGELEHPEGGNTHLERVSHLITKVWLEDLDGNKLKELGLDESEVPAGTYVFGRYEVLKTPRGSILQALHEADVDIGISSRGRGDVRTIDGIDEVQDDYELDTFDAVYLPSVVEAHPKPIREQQDLGSATPVASPTGDTETTPPAGQTTDVTPANTSSQGDWKREAEEVVRALEATVVDKEADVADMAEIFNRSLNLIDQLAALDDEEAIRLKAQALTLTRVLTSKIADLEAGKKSDEGGEKKEKGKVKKEESVFEGTMKDLAQTTSDERKQAEGDAPIFRGEIEAILNKTGHDATDIEVTELANELAALGHEVDTEKYEHLEESKREFQDGECVTITPNKLLKWVSTEEMEQPEEPTACLQKLIEFLEKQKDPVKVRICSHGRKGYVVRLAEPAYGGTDRFIEYNDVKKPETESREEDMKQAELIEGLVRKNDKLEAELKVLKGEEAPPLKKQRMDSNDVPRERYEAAKAIIRGLMERVKKVMQAKAKEEARVKSSVKLIHKLAKVSEAKKKDEKDKKKYKMKKEHEETPPAENPLEEELKGESKKGKGRTITEDSRSLRKRLMSKDEAKNDLNEEKITEDSNLMDAVAHRMIQG